MPIMIWRLDCRRSGWRPFQGVIRAFACFIALCGPGHFLDMVAFFHPMYRLSGHVLTLTGLVSWWTAWSFRKAWPAFVALKSPDELERIIAEQTEELTRIPTPRTRTPVPPPGATSPGTTVPGAMQNVVYNVDGDGRAISVTYWDTGDVIQTEFNVALPWSKQVSLSQSAAHPASVTIINIGHNVTCTLTVDGVQMRQRTGAGITICDAGR